MVSHPVPPAITRRAAELATDPACRAIGYHDLRFGSRWLKITAAFPGSSGWSSFADLADALSQPVIEVSAPDTLARIQEFLVAIESARSLSLVDEIKAIGQALAARVTKSRKPGGVDAATVFARRFGIAGSEQTTLEAIGTHFTLTREAIRQKLDRMMRELPGVTLYVPAYERVCQAVMQRVPESYATLEAELRPLLGEGFELSDLDRYAGQVLGMVPPFEITSLSRNAGTDLVVVMREESPVHGRVAALAKEMIACVGAAQAHWVAAKATEQTEQVVTANYVTTLLSAQEGFSWLDQPGGWFWVGTGESFRGNRLMGRVAKALAGLPGDEFLDIDDLYAAVMRSSPAESRRESSLGTLVVSPEILQEMCLHCAAIESRQSNNFRLRDQNTRDNALSDAERVVYTYAQSRAGIVSRVELARELVDTGKINSATLSLVVDQSPILRRLDRGIFTLTGWPVAKEPLARAIENSVAMNKIATTGPLLDRDGSRVAFQVTVTEGSLKNAQHQVPHRLGEIPEGSYRLIEDVQKPHGEETSGSILNYLPKHRRITGISREARRRNWPIDSLVTVTLDLGTRTASLTKVERSLHALA